MLVAAAAMTFVGCQTNDVDNIASNGTHTVTFKVADVNTKTTMTEGEDFASFAWESADMANFHIFENGVEGLAEGVLDSETGLVTITVAFDDPTVTPEEYVYTGFMSKNVAEVEGKKYPSISGEQLYNGAYDPDFDILVANPITASTPKDELMFQFKRVVAINKVTLKGLEKGDLIESVSFTGEENGLLGYYDFSADQWVNDDSILTAITEEHVAANGTAEVYFISAPAEDATLTIDVITSSSSEEGIGTAAYQKKFGKPITLKSDMINRFGVNLEGCFKPLFYESFNKCDGTGGNDNEWSGTIASNKIKCDNEGWTLSNEYGANKCAKFGTGSKKGSAKTPSIDVYGVATLTFKAAAWDGASEATTLNLSVTNGNISVSSVELKKGEWSEYSVVIYNVESTTQITFEAKIASSNRFFLDEVKVMEGGDAPTPPVIEYEGEGTVESPYTVSDALKYIEAGEGLDQNVYVAGKIHFIEEISVDHGNATYSIAGTDGDTLYVYRGKYLENTNFTSENQISVNDEVVIYGKLKEHESIKEFGQGNYIYKHNGETTNPVTKYAITIASGIQHGTVNTSVSEAVAGAEITLIAIPESGYALDAWDVRDASNATVSVTGDKFTMPASAVTVSATFKKASAESGTVTYDFSSEEGLSALGITVPAAGNGTNLGTSAYSIDPVSLTTAQNGATTATRVWNNSGNIDLRIYAKAYLSFSCSSEITKVEFEGSSVALSPSVGSISGKVWTGASTSVVFTCTANSRITKIKVTYGNPVAAPYLTVTPSEPSEISADGGTVSFSVDTNVDSWTATSSDDTNFTVSEKTADSFKVVISANASTTSTRSATVTLKADGVDDVVINLSQAKAAGDEPTSTVILYEEFDNSSTTDSNTTITSSSFENFSGNTSKAYKSKYGGLKLGSSSASGFITSKSLDLSKPFTVKINVLKYSTDTGKVQITVGDTTKEITPTETDTVYEVEFDAATSSSTVKIGTSAKRAYIDNVVITTY